MRGRSKLMINAEVRMISSRYEPVRFLRNENEKFGSMFICYVQVSREYPQALLRNLKNEPERKSNLKAC